MLLLLFPVLAVCQQQGQRTVPNPDFWANRQTHRTHTDTFTFCDTDADGMMPIPLDAIKSQVLDQNVGEFGTQQGIYLSTRLAKVHLVTDIDATPQQTEICDGSVGLGGYSMLDIAINQDGDMYVAAVDKIYKIDNGNCSVEDIINPGLNGNSITSLSFDRDRNIYLGGFDTSVYRMDYGSYGTMNLWHNFAQGAAAGDFVMCNDKMYVAWRIGSECHLYEVTVDANTNYISHIDLGSLPDNTFGLASELGKLYGVTPFQLYQINRSPLAFVPVLSNTNWSDEWYGAAGMNEAVDFEIQIFETEQHAHDNISPLPSVWTNTIPFGQIVYVVIRNTVDNHTVTIPVQLAVNVAPTFTSPIRITQCEGDLHADVFDIRATEAGIKGDQPNVAVSYHDTLNDADTNVNPLPDVVTANGVPKVIYVRLTNTVTGCYSRFDFVLDVAPKPVFHQPKDLMVCALNRSFVDLNAQISAILNGQQNVEVSFHGSLDDSLVGAHALSVPYQMDQGTTEIFVRVKNAHNGCFETGSFLVKVMAENNDFQLHYAVDIDDWTYDQNAIYIQSTGNYEYSLDGTTYQDSPSFSNLSIGDYRLHVRDKDNCSVSVKEVFVLMYPKFFTPNGDGHHDIWNIVLAWHEPKMAIKIYDRFGKIITTLNGTSEGWDGTLNGAALPASDYWFTVIRESGKEFRGHFTLKR